MAVIGAISLLTGWAGAALPFVYLDWPWGNILSVLLFLLVTIAHNDFLHRRKN